MDPPSLTVQPHETNQLKSCPLLHLEFVHGKRVAVSMNKANYNSSELIKEISISIMIAFPNTLSLTKLIC